jgi:dGTPase
MDAFLVERRYPEPPRSARDHRHPTERDRDRILHSAAFRRLQGKTQVFGIGLADFYRTRLTHSIEAAQIARGIASNLLAEEPGLAPCLTPELAEAAALAHDLGHPPFGHAGERVLDACMREVSRAAHLRGRETLRFEGNAQTFHILVAAEPKSPDYAGLNLTRATLTGVMKYPYEQDAGNDKFIFARDEGMAAWALEGGGVLISAREARREVRPATSITCQILDWADDCAYSLHDIEDALQSEFLAPADLEGAGLGRQVVRRYFETCAGESAPELDAHEIRERMKDLARQLCPPRSGDERAHRKRALRNMLNELITSVSVRQVRTAPRIDFAWRLRVPSESRIMSTLCKAVVWEAVITNPRVAAVSTRGGEILRELFDVLLEDVLLRKRSLLFPRYYRPIIDASIEAGELESVRGVCNFLALLTDMDAIRLYSSLRGSSMSSILTLV